MTQTKGAVGGHFTWLGIALIVLGFVAILTPVAAGGAVVVVIGLILGALIWSQWPMSGLWAVGVLVGLNLMSTGFALLKSDSMLREIATRFGVQKANA